MRSDKFTFTHLTVNNVTGCKESRKEVSWRIIQLTTHLTALVIVASYSASVLSHIMTQTDKLPFNTFEEFLQDGTYTLAVGKHGGHYTHFEVSTVLLMNITDFRVSSWDMTQCSLVL
jgi:hypothetical protein